MSFARLCVAAGVVCAVAPRARGAVAPTEGSLVTRDADSVVPVPLRHTEVRIRATGLVAEVEVDQRFVNPYRTKIDATYLFPLPTGAAVHDLAITTGGRTLTGALVRREDATRRFKLARQDGHVAALLTEERPNLFTQAVANLEPGAEVTVTLRYVETLPFSEGGYELAFPLVAGPRHVPASSRLTAEAAAALRAPVLPAGLRPRTDVGLTVELDAGVPLGALTSPTHALVVERPAPERARVTLGPGDTVPDRDFVLRWTLAGAAPTVAFAAHRDGAQGSFVLAVQPPGGVTARAATPRQLVLLVDTSASMAGAPLALARAAIRRLLEGLGPDDTFQLIRGGDGAASLGPRALANHPANVLWALAWLDALEAGGGTDLVAGVDAALAYPRDPGRLPLVVLFTDGFVGNEDEVVARVAPALGAARLYAFGVGSAVNRWLLEELAAAGRGAVQVVALDEDPDAAVRRFEDRLARPVLTDVAIDWGGLAVTDVTPARLPDLFAGQPLVVTGRFAAAGAGTVQVRGLLGGQPVSLPVAVTLPEREVRPEVAWLWARARIAELERAQLRGEAPAARDEIIRLALAHRLVTPYTAFVAVDESRATRGGPGETVPVAVNVPRGVDRGGVGLRGASGSYALVGSGAGGLGVVGHGSGTGSGGGGSSSLRGVVLMEPLGSIASEGALVDRDRVPADPAPAPPAPVRADLRRCWLASGGHGEARLRLTILLGPAGRVRLVVVAAALPALQACVTTAAAGWSLPESTGDELVVTVKEIAP